MNEPNLSIYHDAGFSTQQMRSLQVFLAAKQLHWINLNENGIYELVLDNQMMADYRACPSYFFEAYVRGVGGKGANWYLEFGVWFHDMMKLYYTEFRHAKFEVADFIMQSGMKLWAEMDLDKHREHKEYKSMGGRLGSLGLIVSYATRFNAENERLRVIGTEIGFGHKKEVPLGSVYQINISNVYPKPVEWLLCYLSGRIDLLVDTGDAICPLDHKTRGSFRFDPSLEYETEEGPTGYIYAVKKTIPRLLDTLGMSDLMVKRSMNKIIMNFISKAIPTEGKERFRRIPIYKSDEQLEDYRLRMLSTHESIFRDLVRFTSSMPLMRDTSKCTQWHMHECLYFPIHRQNSKENEELIRVASYEQKEIWNTEEH